MIFICEIVFYKIHIQFFHFYQKHKIKNKKVNFFIKAIKLFIRIFWVNRAHFTLFGSTNSFFFINKNNKLTVKLNWCIKSLILIA